MKPLFYFKDADIQYFEAYQANISNRQNQVCSESSSDSCDPKARVSEDLAEVANLDFDEDFDDCVNRQLELVGVDHGAKGSEAVSQCNKNNMVMGNVKDTTATQVKKGLENSNNSKLDTERLGINKTHKLESNNETSQDYCTEKSRDLTVSRQNQNVGNCTAKDCNDVQQHHFMDSGSVHVTVTPIKQEPFKGMSKVQDPEVSSGRSQFTQTDNTDYKQCADAAMSPIHGLGAKHDVAVQCSIGAVNCVQGNVKKFPTLTNLAMSSLRKNKSGKRKDVNQLGESKVKAREETPAYCTSAEDYFRKLQENSLEQECDV